MPSRGTPWAHPILDQDDVQRTPPQQLAQFNNAKHTCKECGEHDYPWGIYACDNGGRSRTPSEDKQWKEMSPEEREAFRPEDADHWIKRGNLFDKVLELTIQPEKTKIGSKEVTLKHFNFSTAPGWSTLYHDLSQYDLSPEEMEKLCEPWDLTERYRPEKSVKPSEYPNSEAWANAVLDSQATAAGTANPFQSSDGGKSPWGKKGGGLRNFRSS